MDPHQYALETQPFPYGLVARMAWEFGIRNGTASPISEQDHRQAREGMRWSWMEMDCVREAEVPA